MKLLILRHGRAMEWDEFQAKTPGAADAERPLTAEGIRRLKRQRNGIKVLVPDLEIFATSPLLRARETAKIYETLYPKAKKEEWPVLTPEHSPQEVFRKLRESLQESIQAIALVGHEPQLSEFISWCVFADARSAVDLRKGGAALIEWEGGLRAGRGKLAWLLTSAQLKDVAQNRATF